jgi:hypothetical protein
MIFIPNASWLSTNSRSKRSIKTSRFPECSVVLPQLNDRTAESRRSHLFQTFSDWFGHGSLKHTQRGNEKGGSWGAPFSYPESSPPIATLNFRRDHRSEVSRRPSRLRQSHVILQTPSPLCSILTSSPRLSRGPRKPGFGHINIALDSAQGLVVDDLFVAQFDHGVAFCL